MISISPVEPVGTGFAALLTEADAEGYPFIDRLAREWRDGTHRFARAGEVLLGVYTAGELVAVGALVRDPFAADAGIGRIRHVYVRVAWRRCGVGTALMQALVRHAAGGFLMLHLRAHDAAAAAFYERLGFTVSADPHATHQLRLNGWRASS